MVSPSSPKERREEQDRAAGGREWRLVHLPDGSTATASVRLILFKKARRLYAYLHYKAGGRNVTRYIGQATADDRAEALRIAWELAHERGMLTPQDS